MRQMDTVLKIRRFGCERGATIFASDIGERAFLAFIFREKADAAEYLGMVQDFCREKELKVEEVRILENGTSLTYLPQLRLADSPPTCDWWLPTFSPAQAGVMFVSTTSEKSRDIWWKP